MTAGPSSQSVTAGSSASYVIYVSPLGGFTGSVNLSCPASLPAGVTCSLKPGSLNVGSSAVSANLTLNTTGPTASLVAPSKRRWSPLYAIWLALPGIALAVDGLGSRRKLGFVLAGLLTLSLLLLMAACGGGGSSSGGGGGGGGGGGTQAGTYSLTITGIDGTTQHSTVVTLNVQ
jgi:hypothetical protein